MYASCSIRPINELERMFPTFHVDSRGDFLVGGFVGNFDVFVVGTVCLWLVLVLRRRGRRSGRKNQLFEEWYDT